MFRPSRLLARILAGRREGGGSDWKRFLKSFQRISNGKEENRLGKGQRGFRQRHEARADCEETQMRKRDRFEDSEADGIGSHQGCDAGGPCLRREKK